MLCTNVTMEVFIQVMVEVTASSEEEVEEEEQAPDEALGDEAAEERRPWKARIASGYGTNFKIGEEERILNKKIALLIAL